VGSSEEVRVQLSERHLVRADIFPMLLAGLARARRNNTIVNGPGKENTPLTANTGNSEPSNRLITIAPQAVKDPLK
jgi:hypothetical protein